MRWGGGATVVPSSEVLDVPLPSTQSALPAGMEAVVVHPLLPPPFSAPILMMSAGGSSLPMDVAFVPMP
ncbi:MAG TPA: hypothetical protein VF765_30030 [Polyangiaceae bacterium]